jgi:2-polyprenyl-6-methoxyphenol hydroxylase-like FAD-dependent oxidoreductase
MNGLGSNTCIQDAFNLAWKVAYVEKGMLILREEGVKGILVLNRFINIGIAGKELLSTYNVERQPVGAAIVQR